MCLQKKIKHKKSCSCTFLYKVACPTDQSTSLHLTSATHSGYSLGSISRCSLKVPRQSTPSQVPPITRPPLEILPLPFFLSISSLLKTAALRRSLLSLPLIPTSFHPLPPIFQHLLPGAALEASHFSPDVILSLPSCVRT